MRHTRAYFHPNPGIHADVGGNAMVFTVIVTFVLVCFFVFTIHIGQRFTQRVEMQNAADAAVISGAVWHARGLNTISILNVSMTECLAMIIMFKAFDSTLEYAKTARLINTTIAKACQKYPPSAPFCIPWSICLSAMEKTLKILDSVNGELKKTYEKDSEILWKLMRGLRTVEKGVSYATTVMAFMDANRMARLNGADAFGNGALTQEIHTVFLPLLDTLPVEDGSFDGDLCEHTWNGGAGYDNYLCWDSAMDVEIFGQSVNETFEVMWTLFSCIMPPPVFYYQAMVKMHYKELCPSSGGSISGTIRLQTADCAECRDKRGDSVWNMKTVQTSRPSCSEQYMLADTEVQSRRLYRFSNGRLPQGDILPATPAEDGQDDAEAATCRICNVIRTGEDRYTAQIYELRECEYEEDIAELDLDTDSSGDKPLPLVLVNDWKDRVKYTSLVLKDTNLAKGATLIGEGGDPILSLDSDMSGEHITYGKGGQSHNHPGRRVNIPDRVWSIARAQVYNPAENEADQDLFNQNWHAKLAPCDLEGLTPSYINKYLGNVRIPMLERLFGVSSSVIEEILVH